MGTTITLYHSRDAFLVTLLFLDLLAHEFKLNILSSLDGYS